MSMKALGGSFGERAAATFRAGVDLALHCNGDLGEATAVAEVAPILGGRSLERAERALSLIAGPHVATNLVDARARLDSAIAGLA